MVGRENAKFHVASLFPLPDNLKWVSLAGQPYFSYTSEKKKKKKKSQLHYVPEIAKTLHTHKTRLLWGLVLCTACFSTKLTAHSI